MARLLGPDTGSRLVYTGGGLARAQGQVATVYADSAGQVLADICSFDPAHPTTVGAAIPGSKVFVDASSQVPLFWFPDGADTVWVSVAGGALFAVNADYNARLEAILSGGATAGVLSVAGLTGAVSLPQLAAAGVARRGDLVFNVKDFGAVGDGSTDDTAAIIAAETARAAGAYGGVLFFPPGVYLVNPASGDGVNRIAIPVAGRNCEIRGAGRGRSTIKMASGVGNFKAMLAPSAGSTDVSGLTIRNITLDGNSAGNVISSVSGAALFSGMPRYAVNASVATRVLVEDCEFANWDNVNTIAVNGATVSDVTVRNCLFSNVGANSPVHDHSSIYISGQRMEVAGNAFLGGGISATTAIETHGGSQNVHHNRVASFFALANITGVASSSIGIAVDHNIGRNLGLGIEVWAYTYTGNTSAWGMEHVHITGNVLEIDYDAWSSVTSYRVGIGLDPGSSLGVRDVKIVNNAITYLGFAGTPTATDAQSAGIRLSRTGTYAGVDTDILIAGNTIDSPVAAGVYVGLRNTSTNRFRAKDNLIVNPGQNNAANFAAAYKCGVLLSGVFTDARINRNMTIDDRGTHVINAGIDTSSVTGATNCEAVDNVLRVADGSSVADFLASASASSAFYLRLRTTKYVAPTQATLYGSQITDPTNGVIYTQTTSPSGTTWSSTPTSLAGAVTGLFTSTRYYTAPSAARTTATIGNGDGATAAIPFWVGQTHTFDRIGANITTLATSTNVRLGIWKDNGNGSPGTLVLDAGTIDASTTGAKELTISQSLTVGLYWLSVTPQGGSPTFQALSGALPPMGGGTLAGVTGAGGIYAGIVTAAAATPGALPGTFPAVNNYIAFPPVIALRAA